MITLINAPSILGLRFTGVEHLPDALQQVGLVERLAIQQIENVEPPAYDARRDPETHILNPQGLATYAVDLANATQQVLHNGEFPLVLGGDCSILLGPMLALKRQGRYGLFFLDGHADFYQPIASQTGEAADMDLALISGRGPDLLTNIEGQKPLVKDEDIVQFGQRDREETLEYNSQQIDATDIKLYELDTIRQRGVEASSKEALESLLRQPIEGIWLHIDADVISDDEMPAVDYRQPGGLTFAELKTIVELVMASHKVVGLSLTDYNPKLDPEKRMAARLVDMLSVLKYR